MGFTIDNRVRNEIAHAKFLIAHNAGEVWNWETPAGKLRWQRRAKMLLSHITSDMSVLEIGCGAGYLTKELAKTFAFVTAIDISRDLLRAAKTLAPFPEIRYSVSNAYMLSFGGRTFDTIVGSSVLHHLDVEKALREFYRVLRPGGKIAFTEPNMLNPQIMLQKNIPWIKKACGDSPDETAFFTWRLRAYAHEAWIYGNFDYAV